MSAYSSTRMQLIYFMQKLPVKVSVLISVAGVVCCVLGLATSYWLSRLSFHQGLWTYCRYEIHTDGKWICLELYKQLDAGGEGIGDHTSGQCVGQYCPPTCLHQTERWSAKPCPHTDCRMLIIFSGVLCLAGITLYAIQKNVGHFDGKSDSKNKYNFGWSFIVTVVGGSLNILSSWPLTLEIRRNYILGTYESI
ncbi:uncharacterized protein LOC128204541 [Mya arenaria]|uniref:uncharacterized protein LOC128204541 n=1 Tax=Mya arenaria TaxID=6604 RepID=UPI0022E36D2D|nr:uncharacterized protein LOC128204541 [Mya arenaria]